MPNVSRQPRIDDAAISSRTAGLLHPVAQSPARLRLAIDHGGAVAGTKALRHDNPAMSGPAGSVFTWIWNSAWPLLILANLFWAGNIVVGRAVLGPVPPIALSFWRWTGAFAISFWFAWP